MKIVFINDTIILFFFTLQVTQTTIQLKNKYIADCATCNTIFFKYIVGCTTRNTIQNNL